MKQLTMGREPLVLLADQVESAVRKLYDVNAYTVLSQVRNGTGFEKKPRTADMLVLSTWPSRGLYAIGIEIKVNRYDLQKELANPAKAEEIAKHCTYWFIAIPEGLDENLVIPDNWGIISVNAKLKAKILRQVPLSAAPMDELFVCSILRNFAESHVPKNQIDQRIKSAVDLELKNAENRRNSRMKEMETGIQAFKKHSGVDLMTDWGSFTWDTKGIGEAVKLISALRAHPFDQIETARQSLAAALALIDTALDVIKKKGPVEPAAQIKSAEASQ